MSKKESVCLDVDVAELCGGLVSNIFPTKRLTSGEVVEHRIELYQERYKSGKDIWTGKCLLCGKIEKCDCQSDADFERALIKKNFQP